MNMAITQRFTNVNALNVELGVDVGEDPLGQDGVTAHGVEQTRHRRLGCKAGGKLSDDEPGQEH
jgi:hypothetical protein